MSDLPRYWTQAFLDRFVEAMNSDAGFQKAAKSFSNTVVMQCIDTPDDKDVSIAYHIERGRVRADLREEPAPSADIRRAPFDKRSVFARTTAPYTLWTKLDRGEMGVLSAIRSPDYNVEGSKLKIVANVGLFNAMSAVASRLPKRY